MTVMEPSPSALKSSSWTVVDVLAGLAAAATAFATVPALAPLLGLGQNFPAELLLRLLLAVGTLAATIALSSRLLTGPLSRRIKDKHKAARVAGSLGAAFAIVILVFWI